MGTNAGGGSVRARRNASARKKGEGENGHGSVGIRTGARARRARFADGRRVEGLAGVQAPVCASGEHSDATGENSEPI